MALLSGFHPMGHVFRRTLLHAGIDAIATVGSTDRLMRANRLGL